MIQRGEELFHAAERQDEVELTRVQVDVGFHRSRGIGLSADVDRSFG
jgi:hypothetical protein